MNEVSKETLSYLKFVMLGQLLLDAHEDLINTNQYRNNIKLQVGRSVKLLEGHISSSYDKVYISDPEMTTNVMNKVSDLTDKILSANLDELVMIDAIIDKYNENKEWFMEHSQAEFLRLR